MIPLVDSHCHLADEAFSEDLEAVVGRARAAGVAQMLCILAAGDAGEAARANQLAMLAPEVRFAIGVHPHQAGRFAARPEEAASIVGDALDANPLARALGEIGLDYHYDFAPREVQRQVFRAQVRLARERGLPVVIHTREAEADTLAILSEAGAAVPGIFHCFTGDGTLARRILDLGCHISFAGILTFPRAAAVRDAARIVPDERLLIETDSPYLAPVPRRGRRNEPALVAATLRTLSEIRDTTPDALALAIEGTYRALVCP